MVDVGHLKDGVLLLSGNREVRLQLREQTVLGVQQGTRNQLSELVQLVAAKKVRR